MCPGHLSPITYERFKCNTEVKSEKCNLARDTSCYALQSIQIFFVGIRHQRESNWHCLRFVWILGPVCQRRNRDAACWSPSTLSFHPQSGWKHARASFLLRGSFCGLESTSAVLTAWFFFYMLLVASGLPWTFAADSAFKVGTFWKWQKPFKLTRQPLHFPLSQQLIQGWMKGLHAFVVTSFYSLRIWKSHWQNGVGTKNIQKLWDPHGWSSSS